MGDDIDIYTANLQEERKDEAAVKAFVTAAVSGDTEAFVNAFGLVEGRMAWRQTFKAVSEVKNIDESIRRLFLEIWLEDGDTIRGQTGDDDALVDGLWALLPNYHGSPVTLFRGETLFDHSHRNYGMSWTSDKEVAKHHALKSQKRSIEGGAVVVRTDVSSNAIICVPSQFTDSFSGEVEYIVDGRRLGPVIIVERYPQSVES